MNCANCGGPTWPAQMFCTSCGAPVQYGRRDADPAPAPGHATRNWLIAVVAVLLVALGTTTGLLLGRRTAAPTAAVATTRTPSAVTSRVTPSASPATTSAAAPLDFAEVYAKQRSGVVRIDVVGCSDSGVGSGFLLSPTLIATVDHVTTASVVVSLVDGDQHTTGRVIGSDPATDVALVQADHPLSGYHFRFASQAPEVGDRVAAIGFPIGDPITLTQGGVSGLNRMITVDGQARSGLIETDAPINPGNSGGPLLAADGTVFGLVDAKNVDASGIGYAVPATQASAEIQTWSADPQPQAPASCSAPLGPTEETTQLPQIGGVTPDASAGITAALQTYFDGINDGDYASAYGVLSPRQQTAAGERAFAAGDATSYDFDVDVITAEQLSPTSASVAVSFTSIQTADKGPDHDTCDDWTLTYTMVADSAGDWYIDRTAPYDGTTHSSC